MLKINYTPQFLKDVKRLKRKHYDLELLKSIVELVREDSNESLAVLKQKNNMHILKGS